jgi:hypothetical protein
MPALAPIPSRDDFADSAAGVSEAPGGRPLAVSMLGVSETLVVVVGVGVRLEVADLTRLVDSVAGSTYS